MITAVETVPACTFLYQRSIRGLLYDFPKDPMGHNGFTDAVNSLVNRQIGNIEILTAKQGNANSG
jgi:hypothetical protein